jgi:hypothetical protein
MDQSNMSPQPTEIAIWGPTQSGKDWLYKGFAKELEFYDQDSEDFNFVLQEKKFGSPNFKLTIAMPPTDIRPTSYEEDYVLRFIRRPKPGKNSDELLLSSHNHDINFHNNRGANLIASIMDLDSDYFEPTQLSLQGSRYILIVLDPKFDKNPDIQPDITDSDLDTRDEFPDIALRPGLSKEKYYQMLLKLLDMLANANIPDKYLAICITKTDALRITSYSPWNLLERAFGQKIYKLVNTYRNIFNIEVFATSAAGYINRKGESVANFDQGKLIDAEKWRPVNCAAPFFWIFQNKEIERIKLSSNFLNKDYNLRKYIKYPLQRPTW